MKTTSKKLTGGIATGMLIGLFAATAPAQQLTGEGEWRSLLSAAIKGTWSATLARSGNRLEGNLDLSGSNVFSGGSVAGELDTSGITLGVMVDGAEQAAFAGKLDGESITGEWVCDAVKDHGVWYGTLRFAKPQASSPTQE